MRKLVTIALLGGLLLLVGCHPSNYSNPSEYRGHRVVIIDGCQYLVGAYGTIIHKANCTNHVQKPVQLPPSEYPVAPLWPNLPRGFNGYYITNSPVDGMVKTNYVDGWETWTNSRQVLTNNGKGVFGWKLEDSETNLYTYLITNIHIGYLTNYGKGKGWELEETK